MGYLDQMYAIVKKGIRLAELRKFGAEEELVPLTEELRRERKALLTLEMSETRTESSGRTQAESAQTGSTLTEESMPDITRWTLARLFGQLRALPFERHVIYLLLTDALRPEISSALKRIDPKATGVTPALCLLTYEEEMSSEECFHLTFPDSPLVRSFLEGTGKAFRMDGALRLKESVLEEILGEDTDRPIGHAKPMSCPFTMEDIVLPESCKDELRQACDQVRYRERVYGDWEMGRVMAYGRGVSILLSGPPGTGKTMAAQVIAGELNMELYRVSLAAVVSKYIGETEKNLEEIFTGATGKHVVLLFDEADVLFGKRTEIRDANDKYSNMEAAYLLQRIEEYEGVVVLATNYRKNFDEAFGRRMKFVIDIPFPDAQSRLEIWQRAIPERLGTENLDLKSLSERFELTGSNIKNIVLHAAFLTAAAGEEMLTTERVLAAVKHEYQKMGKILSDKELQG